ncbi:ABC transporter permease [Afifella pfennigii]|uniref:ABC transporter permease n=1 Tax=Afifella pfennigii TaxID=209897 RepID=UPI00047CFDD2|nr:ABC transporter permease subunit [Afifella pfennigii]
MRQILDSLLLVLALALVWQGLYWLAGDLALASPAQTFARAAELLATPSFWRHASETFLALGYALLIAVTAGMGIGLALGMHRLSGEVAEPVLVSLYSLPKITLYPVILLLFGLGISAKIALGVIHGIIPIIIFSMGAVRAIAPVYFKTARVLRLSRGQLVRTVIVPAAIPELVSGLRVGFSLTLLGVLIGEMFASQRGLGYLVMKSIGTLDVPTMMAVIVMLALVAVLISSLLLYLDHRLHRRAL